MLRRPPEQGRLRTKTLHDVEHAEEPNERVVSVLVLKSPLHLVDQFCVKFNADVWGGRKQRVGSQGARGRSLRPRRR